MNAATAMPGNTAATFLVHFLGSGLADEKYVVERLKAHADGDIRPRPGETPAKGRGRPAKRVTARLKAFRETEATAVVERIAEAVAPHSAYMGSQTPRSSSPPRHLAVQAISH